MSAKELSNLADEMSALLSRFQKSSSEGYFLTTEDQAVFKRLAIEAKSIIDGDLGRLNDFSFNLISSINAGSGGFFGGPSYAAVSESIQLVRGAINAIQRKPTHHQNSITRAEPYVDSTTIAALRAMCNPTWDFQRLIRTCEEINVANEHKCYLSIAMLVRSIVDHIPPVFSQTTFSAVANNYPAKSIKGSLQNLDRSLRNIADAQLHTHIQAREAIPTAVHVNFRNDLAVLLSEIIRVASGPKA